MISLGQIKWLESSSLSFPGENQAIVLDFAGLRTFPVDPVFGQVSGDLVWACYGLLITNPTGILDLPEGFTCRMLSKAGDRMDDGLMVPNAHDGMGAFPGPNRRTILI